MSDITTNTLSLRAAFKALSIAHGQGVLKCNCAQGSCVNGKCTCKKANQKCSSRCHGGNVNENCKNAWWHSSYFFDILFLIYFLFVLTNSSDFKSYKVSLFTFFLHSSQFFLHLNCSFCQLVNDILVSVICQSIQIKIQFLFSILCLCLFINSHKTF